MDEMVLELKRLAERLLDEKWAYKIKTKPYVKDVMSYMKQEQIMQALDLMNLRELRQLQGCGIPGDAWTYCNTLIKKKVEEIELFIIQGGSQATSTVEEDTEPEDRVYGA